MEPSDEPQRVQFHSPASLVERLDAIAEVYDTNRSALLVEALREYLKKTADSEPFQELVATKYYGDKLDFETVTELVGGETAQRFRLLKADLETSHSISLPPTTSTSTMATRQRLTTRSASHTGGIRRLRPF